MLGCVNSPIAVRGVKEAKCIICYLRILPFAYYAISVHMQDRMKEGGGRFNPYRRRRTDRTSEVKSIDHSHRPTRGRCFPPSPAFCRSARSLRQNEQLIRHVGEIISHQQLNGEKVP